MMVAWLAIMVLEVGNGLLRKMFVEPLVGDSVARQVGVAIGSLMVILVAYLLAGWLRLRRKSSMALVGMAWVVLTLGFEIGLGRVLMGLSWDRILSDYDVVRGGLMPAGLLVMAFAPFAGSWLYRSVRMRRTRKARRRQVEDVPSVRSARAATSARASRGGDGAREGRRAQ